MGKLSVYFKLQKISTSSNNFLITKIMKAKKQKKTKNSDSRQNRQPKNQRTKYNSQHLLNFKVPSLHHNSMKTITFILISHLYAILMWSLLVTCATTSISINLKSGGALENIINYQRLISKSKLFIQITFNRLKTGEIVTLNMYLLCAYSCLFTISSTHSTVPHPSVFTWRFRDKRNILVVWRTHVRIFQ